MRKDNLNGIKKPEAFIDDPITQVLQNGARKLLANALEVEINSFLEQYSGLLDDQGKKRITRNGYLPEREIQTGIGSVRVKAPRACDRKGEGKNKIKFKSSILPVYLRKTKSIETLIPWLYLKGISTGGFSEALAALVGQDALGLSASTISRLKSIWEDEYQQWQNQDLSGKHFPNLMKQLPGKDAGFIKQPIF